MWTVRSFWILVRPLRGGVKPIYYCHYYYYYFYCLFYITLLTFDGMWIPGCHQSLKSDFRYIHGNKGYTKLYNGIKTLKAIQRSLSSSYTQEEFCIHFEKECDLTPDSSQRYQFSRITSRLSFKQGDRCIHFLTSLKAHLRQTRCQPSPQLVNKSEANVF